MNKINELGYIYSSMQELSGYHLKSALTDLKDKINEVITQQNEIVEFLNQLSPTKELGRDNG